MKKLKTTCKPTFTPHDGYTVFDRLCDIVDTITLYPALPSECTTPKNMTPTTGTYTQSTVARRTPTNIDNKPENITGHMIYSDDTPTRKRMTQEDVKARIIENAQKDTPINNTALMVERCYRYENPSLPSAILHLSALIVRARLHAIARTNNYSDGKIARSLCADINRIFNFTAGMYRADIMQCMHNTMTDNEYCKVLASLSSDTLVMDMIQTAYMICSEYIATQKKHFQAVELLTPFEKSYADTYKDGTPKPDAKIRKKWTNIVREMATAVKTVFDAHKTQYEIPHTGLYDRDGKLDVSLLSAISDTYGDIEIDENMKEIFAQWIDDMDLKESYRSIATAYYIDGVEQSRIAKKYGISVDDVKKRLERFRNKLSHYINEKFDKKIEKSISKKMVVCYNLSGHTVAKYESVSQAARCIGVSRTAIQKAIKCPKIATCGGYTWDKVTV